MLARLERLLQKLAVPVDRIKSKRIGGACVRGHRLILGSEIIEGMAIIAFPLP